MRKGIPAAIFVVTDWIGTSKLLSHDRLYRILARGWPHSVEVLTRHGVVVVGSIRRAGPFEALRQLLTSRPQSELAHLSAMLEEELDLHEDIPASLKPLSWEMLATMHRAGIIVGSHTRSHPVLTCESPANVLAEVTDSRDTLQRWLAEEIRYFAYPDGAYDLTVLRAVAEAGYRLALTACHHRNHAHPSLTVPRRLFWENTSIDSDAQFSPAVLSCLCGGVFDLFASCTARAHA
jgi:peptidoglycan/xylan/chitin deacetylase (PgdA/CDA1 family)